MMTEGIIERAKRFDSLEDVQMASALYDEIADLGIALSCNDALDAAVIFILCADYGFVRSYNIAAPQTRRADFLVKHFLSQCAGISDHEKDVKFWSLYHLFIRGDIIDFDHRPEEFIDSKNLDALVYFYPMTPKDADLSKKVRFFISSIQDNESTRSRYIRSILSSWKL